VKPQQKDRTKTQHKINNNNNYDLWEVILTSVECSVLPEDGLLGLKHVTSI
jgi:hypothetical protein